MRPAFLCDDNQLSRPKHPRHPCTDTTKGNRLDCGTVWLHRNDLSGAYAIGLAIFGWFVDKYGTKIGYALSITGWSIAAMAHALASTVFGFSVARFFLGLSESGNFPSAIKATAEWFPKKERALATGIFNSGANIGAVVAPAVVPWLTVTFGWQAAFVATGATGFLWLVLWMIVYEKPETAKKGYKRRDGLHSQRSGGYPYRRRCRG